MKITIVAGTRPNFIKVASIMNAINQAKRAGADLDFRLVHTGQHYDYSMSDGFFEELNIPAPSVNLGCGGGTQAEQTGAIMVKFEQELINHKPELVIVVGDVTSTMACTVAAKKLCIDVAHVEAGIRSFDMTMPEEINRMVTDAICDLFFTTSTFANTNLAKHAVALEKIHFVGNTMIDTLLSNLDRLRQPKIWNEKNLQKRKYFLLTLHRPSNVDDPAKLQQILAAVTEGVGDHAIVFPVHPRTKKVLDSLDLRNAKLLSIEPMPYLEFIYLIKNAKGIVTDSGGITEEATVLDVPCLTLRENTERPETVHTGTNELIGNDLEKLHACLRKIINGEWKKGALPPMWDGRAAERIVSILIKHYENKSIQIGEK